MQQKGIPFTNIMMFSLAGVVSLLVVTGWLSFGGQLSIYMNVDVAQAHAKVEATCTSCHQPWTGVVADRCITCHGTTVLGKNHELLVQDCVACHREHNVRGKDLVPVAVSQCLDCHAEVISEGRHPQ